MALVFASVVTAYAAANTVPDTYAGDGAGAISGYAISAVHYNLDAANPADIVSVTFDTTPNVTAGSTVKIQLVSGGTWYGPCTFAGATVTCTTTGATVFPADSLRVVIAD